MDNNNQTYPTPSHVLLLGFSRRVKAACRPWQQLGVSHFYGAAGMATAYVNIIAGSTVSATIIGTG